MRAGKGHPHADRQAEVAEARLHVALDNMPDALVYTDDDLKIVFCNDRFREMYAAPTGLLERGRPYPDFLRFLAEHGYYGEGDVDALVAKRVESLAIHRAGPSKIARRMATSIRFAAVGWRPAA